MLVDKTYGIVYRVVNVDNSKSYIGQTIKSLDIRRKMHYIEAKRSGFYFHNVLNKYNNDIFKWEILEYCNSKEEMNEMEFHYIKQYNAFRPYGYNLTYGGDGMVGFKFTEESKCRMSEIRKGRKMTESARLKLILNHKDVSGKNNPMYGVTSLMKGKKHSLETRLKISKIGRGRKFSEEYKKKLSEAAKRRWGVCNE